MCQLNSRVGKEPKGPDPTWCLQQKLTGNEGKPILLFFNQPWCGACNRLKDNLKQEGKKLKDIAKDFLLINVAGEENNSFDVRMLACLHAGPPLHST